MKKKLNNTLFALLILANPLVMAIIYIVSTFIIALIVTR